MMMRIFPREYNFLLPDYWFGTMDSRALSFFRIVFALLLLKDALYHLPIAYWFYSDEGITPRNALFDGLAREARFSLMDAISAPWMAQFFFICWIIVLVGLLAGYRTRLMTVLNFVFLLSIHERNLYVIDGADNVMRVVSFWCMFIPLGHYYSVDVVLHRFNRYRHTQNPSDLRVPEAPRTTFAFPVRLLQLQVALIYLFTFILKLPGDPWMKGEALHYALQLQSLTLPTGDWVLENAPFWMLQAMTYFALVAEGTFFFFVFVPILQPYLRILALTLGFVLHMGIAVLMSVPNFSMLMPTTYLVFFMPQWIEAFDNRLRLPKQHLFMPLPKSGSPLWGLLAVTKASEIEFVTEVRTEKWWFADSENHTYAEDAAWQQLAAHLPLSRLWGWLLRLRIFQQLLWTVLGWLAPSLPMPIKAREHSQEMKPISRWRERLWIVQRLVLAGVLSALMTVIFYWNLTSIKADNEPIVPVVVGLPDEVVHYLGIWQSWNMFSPYPSTIDGWVQIPGVFENSQRYDLLTTAPLEDDMRRWFYGPGMRWKKYEENLNRHGYEDLLSAWGGYYCHKYNIENALPEGERLATLEIHFIWRESYAPGETEHAWQPYVMWKHWCYNKYAY